MTPFTQRVVTILQSIPQGRVMTYGQIAGLAGNPQAARQVVRILHALSEKENLPWHRVINAKGQIGFHDRDAIQTQKRLLENEGVRIEPEGQIDLSLYQWHP